MKSLTRVALPILLVAGVVFGITFIRMYSPPDEQGGADSTKESKNVPREQVLKFYTTKAAVTTPASTPKHLWYWDSTIEVGAPGHFEFWCQNRHEQPVTIWVPATNCQCAGAEMANVPPDAYKEYAVVSALAGSPLVATPNPIAALAHLNLSKRLNWLPLFKGEDRPEQTIPAANPSAGPQFALVRMVWTGKGEPGPKGVSAEVYARIGDGIPSKDQIVVEASVVAAFEPTRREGSDWLSAREVSVGELQENSEVRQTIFLASFTRNHFLFSVDIERPTPCITWTEPVPATEEEMASIIAHTRGSDNKLRRVKSLFKFDVIVRERTETVVNGRREFQQLDLGPIDRKLTIAGVDAGHWSVKLKGRVLGEIAIPQGAEGGNIDLGTFAADQGASKEIQLVADRLGLDLSLLPSETTPSYLKARLDPLPNTPDGRKVWRLKVSVPKGMLYGSLPDSSGVMLKTSGTSSRRLRLPVRGMTYDTGGPHL